MRPSPLLGLESLNICQREIRPSAVEAQEQSHCGGPVPRTARTKPIWDHHGA